MNEKDDKITHLGILSNLENGRILARFSNSPGTGKTQRMRCGAQCVRQGKKLDKLYTRIRQVLVDQLPESESLVQFSDENKSAIRDNSRALELDPQKPIER